MVMGHDHIKWAGALACCETGHPIRVIPRGIWTCRSLLLQFLDVPTQVASCTLTPTTIRRLPMLRLISAALDHLHTRQIF